LITLPKNFWTKVLGSVVIQLYASECMLSADRALRLQQNIFFNVPHQLEKWCKCQDVRFRCGKYGVQISRW